MSRTRLVNVLLLVALVVASVLVNPRLPERYPVHFGLDGTPNRWATRESGEWFFVPALAIGLWVFLLLIGGWAVRRPALVNLPNKDKLMRLSPERQREALAGLGGMMDLLTVVLTLVFVVTQVGIYESAVGGNGPLWIGVGMMLSLVATPVVVFWRMNRVTTRIDELAREEAAGPPARTGS